MKSLPYFFIILAIICSCSGPGIRPDTADEELAAAAGILDRDRNSFDRINKTSYPGKGYFYIIDMNGKILMHPEPALRGMDFSRYDFVKKILKTKKGCLSVTSGGHIINVFFTTLDNGDILCFSFESAQGQKTYKECVNQQ